MTDQVIWNQNKNFFGTSNLPDQINKLLDIIKSQDARLDSLEARTLTLEDILHKESKKVLTLRRKIVRQEKLGKQGKISKDAI